MNNRSAKIDLGAVQETLILPLWARAKDAEKNDPIVNDTLAKDLIARIDYDFSRLAGRYLQSHLLAWPIRAYQFDRIIRDFLRSHADGAVINIGAGLDTTFRRVDNGRMMWINLELPDTAALRLRLIPDSERELTIAKSVSDFTWTRDIGSLTEGRPVLLMAAGVLCYFESSDVEALFHGLADAYPSGHFVFDAMSRFTVWVSNRKVVGKAGMDVSARLKWHLNRASRLKKWIEAIEVVEEYSMFSGIPIKPDWSAKLRRDVKMAGRLRLYRMVHVRFLDRRRGTKHKPRSFH